MKHAQSFGGEVLRRTLPREHISTMGSTTAAFPPPRNAAEMLWEYDAADDAVPLESAHKRRCVEFDELHVLPSSDSMEVEETFPRGAPRGAPSDSMEVEETVEVTEFKREVKAEFKREVETTADERLQLFLTDIKFDFRLQPHQFEAVRFVAGITKEWPSYLSTPNPKPDPNPDWISKEWPPALYQTQYGERTFQSYLGKKTLDGPRLPRVCEDPRTPGGVLADVMGLGKTVELLGGVRIRDWIQTRKRSQDMPFSIMVGPNSAVLDQWEDHALKAGYDKFQILRFAGGKKGRSDLKAKIAEAESRRDGRCTGVLLLSTVHKLQGEMRSCFKSYRPEVTIHGMTTDATYKRSPLFPKTPASIILDLGSRYYSQDSSKRRSAPVKEMKNVRNRIAGESLHASRIPKYDYILIIALYGR